MEDTSVVNNENEKMPQLVHLTSEILHNILQYVSPIDLANLSKSCKTFASFIRADGLLWKLQYHNRYDCPSSICGSTQPDWKVEVQRLVNFQALLASESPAIKEQFLTELASTAIELSQVPRKTENSSNLAFLDAYFNDEINIAGLLCRSSLFKDAGSDIHIPARTENERQLSAKLSVFFGQSLEPSEKLMSEENQANAIHPYARARVYDLRRYNEQNAWGPFLDDGSYEPDWEKLQAIMTDLGYNLRLLAARTNGTLGGQWEVPFAGLAPYSFISEPLIDLPKEPPRNIDAEDPYGVSGKWIRIVCFLDYINLYRFNFPEADREESSPLSNFQDREPNDDTEAIRMIILKLRVTSIEPPEEGDAQDMPVVHFTGTSRSMHMSFDPNANSRIRGSVRTTPGGAIRWTSFSIYHGEERWRSEGVQIGGIRSARGVMGTWFDKDYDVHGPAGPTAFWKLSDEVDEDKPANLPQHSLTFFS